MIRTILMAASALALAACNRPAPAASESTALRAAYRPNLYIDPKTGCEYLVVQGEYESGISARFHQNGLPICHGVER